MSNAGPARRSLRITPSDTVNLAQPADAIYVGTGGDVAIVYGGSVTIWPSVPSGFIIPCNATRINATGTTADGLVALLSTPL